MKVKVNEQYNFEVAISAQALKVNGQALGIDAKALSGSTQHIIYQNKSYTVEVVEREEGGKQVTIKVNGNLYQVNIEDQYDELLKQLGMDNAAAQKVQEIKAPMPGLVLQLVVCEGQEVAKGDSLLVLEAMKMENIIKSPAAGIVKRIMVQKGDKVEKNGILIQFA
ncbi:biotin/lipoyl-containing protein [Pedobacter gandavensis]|uniref:Biotin/lipoyl-binding protein n=1 Tax=Pedobacter gandavensis TaxID=2679963 RepID=A0ABR6EY89_9SPHI|nr:acetyl-CoA carboxylase biotin carboxyl carrier protein subunit [Pedobacter gandavensis]MBB2149997.1 biotin/lipoyl-binding protein [Pedobacter gandavensis]